MIKVFYGEDRVRAQGEIDRILGTEYEVVEGENLGLEDLPSLFLGVSLFEIERRILVKDLSENETCWVELPKYLGTTHKMVIWESRLDKRTTAYKELVAKKVEIREFGLMEVPEKKLVFDVLDVAWRGEGRRAVEILGQIEVTSDPFMFVGLVTSQLMRKLESGDKRASKAMKLLAECDMRMKTTKMRPWTLVKAVMIEIAAIK